MELVREKRVLRQRIAQIKKACTPELLAEQSKAVAMQLMEHPQVQKARTLLTYHSLPDEVALEELLAVWLPEKRVLLPKVVGEHLSLHSYTCEGDMAHGAYGILEPTTPAFERWEDIEVIIVPGVAFDRLGHRVGRGKGYYDRLLSTLVTTYRHRPYLIGVCFDFQLVDDVPYEAHDWCMDEVLAGGTIIGRI